jgi:hypothetical protein
MPTVALTSRATELDLIKLIKIESYYYTRNFHDQTHHLAILKVQKKSFVYKSR